MNRSINLNRLYKTAHLDFLGVQSSKITTDLDVCLGTLTNWSKRPEWMDLQRDLAEKQREQILSVVDAVPHASTIR